MPDNIKANIKDFCRDKYKGVWYPRRRIGKRLKERTGAGMWK